MIPSIRWNTEEIVEGPFNPYHIFIGDQGDSRTLLKNGRSHNYFVDTTARIARIIIGGRFQVPRATGD